MTHWEMWVSSVYLHQHRIYFSFHFFFLESSPRWVLSHNLWRQTVAVMEANYGRTRGDFCLQWKLLVCREVSCGADSFRTCLSEWSTHIFCIYIYLYTHTRNVHPHTYTMHTNSTQPGFLLFAFCSAQSLQVERREFSPSAEAISQNGGDLWVVSLQNLN